MRNLLVFLVTMIVVGCGAKPETQFRQPGQPLRHAPFDICRTKMGGSVSVSLSEVFPPNGDGSSVEGFLENHGGRNYLGQLAKNHDGTVAIKVMAETPTMDDKVRVRIDSPTPVILRIRPFGIERFAVRESTFTPVLFDAGIHEYECTLTLP